MTLERGTLLHKRYRIVEILGQGGMGSVYRAVDENLGVDVALKENLFTTDEYARQFRLEAVILANLRHANLPRVSDHFVVGDQGQYLVMDYIEGEDLRQRMERLGNLSEEDVILIGAAMCDALAYLHTRKPSILHRDLKPGNVKITPEGHIFLVDFGLAKVVQGSQATTTGARAMTPGYSPPEQYGTARTDPRTDVYSLGATLYASLCGVIPEDGLARAMDNAQLTPLRKRNPKITRRLAQVIEKSMAVDPAERYQTAEEFKKALLGSKSKTQRLSGDYMVAPPPPPGEEDASAENPAPKQRGSQPAPAAEALEAAVFKPPKKKRRSSGCGIWLFLLLIALAAAWFLLPEVRARVETYLAPAATAAVQPSATSSPTKNPPTSEPATLTATAMATVTLTPAFTATPFDTPEPTQIIPPSPTAQGGGNGQFAFSSTRTGVPQIYLADIASGEKTPLTNLEAGACQPAWSPDGTRIAFTSPCLRRDDTFKNSSIYVMNADGSDIQPLVSETGGNFDPAWSPDGNRLAFVGFRNGRSQLFLYDFASGALTPLPNFSSDVVEVRYPAWSPFGNQIAFTARRFSVYQIWVMADNGQGQQQVARSGQEYWDVHPAWSPDGETLLFSQRRINIGSKYYLMTIRYTDRQSGLATRLNYGSPPIEFVSFSPDGFWLIFEGQDEAGNTDIFMMTVNGGNRLRLTDDPGADFSPAWRPIIP
ncbi:MAG: Protein TolB [Anaerolineales bacterium]|nr:Protein TolB [Anaerolineales bacterium]